MCKGSAWLHGSHTVIICLFLKYSSYPPASRVSLHLLFLFGCYQTFQCAFCPLFKASILIPLLQETFYVHSTLVLNQSVPNIPKEWCFISIMIFDLYELHNRVIDVYFCLLHKMMALKTIAIGSYLTVYIPLCLSGPMPMLENMYIFVGFFMFTQLKAQSPSL